MTKNRFDRVGRFFDRFSLSARMLAPVACFVLLLGGLGFFSQHVLKTSKEIVLDIAGSKAGHWLYQGLIYQKEVQLQLVQANSLYKEKTVLTVAQLKDLDSAVQSVGFSINSYELEVKKPSEVELAGLKKMKDQFATAKAAVEAMKQTYLKAGATSESLTKAINDINDLFLVLCDTFDETATAIRNKNIDYNVVMEASEKKNSYILYSMWFVSFLIATITFFSSKRITNTLLQVTDHFNKMGQQVSSVGDSILGASQNLSVSSTSQASAIQETSASVEEITSMVTRTAENSKHGQSLGLKTKEATVHGKKSIDDLILEIGNIEKRNEELAMQIDVSNQQLASIVTLVSDIGVKTKSIDEIVFQTKLLSFNASVEAARAGESGKGFAVVAEEVGNLAKLSGEISKDINLVLENGIQKAQALVSENKTRVEVLVNAGQEAIARGSEVAEKCGTVFEGIVSTVEQVNHLLIDISQANSEQSSGMRQIAKAMELIDQSSQSTTAASSETSNAAESLAQQTDQLANLVSELTLITRGRNEKTRSLYLNPSQNENSLRTSLA